MRTATTIAIVVSDCSSLLGESFFDTLPN
jgi:hypothetical protein